MPGTCWRGGVPSRVCRAELRGPLPPRCCAGAHCDPPLFPSTHACVLAPIRSFWQESSPFTGGWSPIGRAVVALRSPSRLTLFSGAVLPRGCVHGIPLLPPFSPPWLTRALFFPSFFFCPGATIARSLPRRARALDANPPSPASLPVLPLPLPHSRS